MVQFKPFPLECDEWHTARLGLRDTLARTMPWITMIDRAEARGELATVYNAMAARPVPSAYTPPHGGMPGIIRAHSLDPALIGAAFGTSGSLHAGDVLPWHDRELVAASASRINQCVY
jgi:alkylhydroperoxidase family enzyme